MSRVWCLHDSPVVLQTHSPLVSNTAAAPCFWNSGCLPTWKLYLMALCNMKFPKALSMTLTRTHAFKIPPKRPTGHVVWRQLEHLLVSGIAERKPWHNQDCLSDFRRMLRRYSALPQNLHATIYCAWHWHLGSQSGQDLQDSPAVNTKKSTAAMIHLLHKCNSTGKQHCWIGWRPLDLDALLT